MIVSMGAIGALSTIRDVQLALIKLGYDVGPSGADNILGPATAAAVRKFQVDVAPQAGPIDGKPGPLTRAALEQRVAALSAPTAPPVRLSLAVPPPGASTLFATSARTVAAQLAAEAAAAPSSGFSNLFKVPGGAEIAPPSIVPTFDETPVGFSAPSVGPEGVSVGGRTIPTVAIVAGLGIAAALGVFLWRRASA